HSRSKPIPRSFARWSRRTGIRASCPRNNWSAYPAFRSSQYWRVPMWVNGKGLLALFALALLLPSGRAQQEDKAKLEPAQSARDLEVIWTDFGQNDDEGTRKAYQDIGRLIRAPQLALPFLKEKLKP